ncbi:MAG: hypothetical protein JWQ98_3530 [Chlorobi bacterium]|nr:hypothetical protein [Chlorobiota bacterium]
MPTPYESGQLLLKLFELRRDPLLREARNWYIRSFFPKSADDVIAAVRGPESAKFRMVIGYWDMAASLVTNQAIDAKMFHDANPEMLPTFAKVYPFIAEIREVLGSPHYIRHIEDVVLAMSDAKARLELFARQFVAMEERLKSPQPA